MMEEGYNKKSDPKENDIVFSRAIKAGKRIYYLDVKRNKKNELFLAITESKKVSNEFNNSPTQFEKHKIFLYKEDFDKFVNGLQETLDYIRENNTVDFVPRRDTMEGSNKETTDIEERLVFADKGLNLRMD